MAKTTKTNRPLTSFRLSLIAVKKRKRRYISLLFIIIFSGILIGIGTLSVFVFTKGIERLNARLGADALIVPAGYEKKAENVLLSGSPSAFQLPSDLAVKLSAFDGIKQASPQLFLASFNSAHCSAEVQLIGIDTATDFLIAPWLTAQSKTDLKNGQIIVGDKILGDIGSRLKFFGREYTVSGKLEATGTGLDSSVFLDINTARTQTLDDYISLGGKELSDRDGVSAIAVKLNDGVDPRQWSSRILDEYRRDSFGVVLPQSLIRNISGKLGVVTQTVKYAVAALWGFTVFILAVLFSLIINERRREFGVYRLLGASRTKLVGIAFTETIIISAAGSVIGIVVTEISSEFLIKSLAGATGFPAAALSGKETVFISLAAFILVFLAAPLSALIATAKIGKLAAYSMTSAGD